MIKQIINEQFGFNEIEVTKLDGYNNCNYLINTEAGKYIFKTYLKGAEKLELVEAENKTLLFLQNLQNNEYPEPVQFLDGSYVKCMYINGQERICRLLTFLEGKFLGDVKPTEALFESLGSFLARIDLKLQTFNNPVYRARQWEWDIQYLSLNKKYIKDIHDPKNRNLVRYFIQQFEQNVVPLLPQLRKSIIHNDANEWNVLVKNGKVSAIIDFGDLAHSPLINDLAVALTYACYDKKKPLDWAAIILKSYHGILPIEEIEISLLYYLIAARLCISVCNSGYLKKVNSSNEYILVSEKPAWEMLHLWVSIGPIKTENIFRSAIGLEPAKPETVNACVEKRHKRISPVLTLSYTRPLYLKKSAFQYMYDAYGNTFLDAYNNIPHVGHSHPLVVEAGQKQMAKLNTNTRYLYDELQEYSERLLSKFPHSLNKVYFVNSGSAAADLAIRLAQTHTSLQKIMVMEHGYHGHTQSAFDISHYKFSGGGHGPKDHIIATVLPDTYRGKYKNNDGTAGKMYARDAIELIRQSGSAIAAFISEPVVGCGGQVPLAKGYLKELYPEIRKQGGVCISDEVQLGFGRLGDHFWGFEQQGVIPDIVIVGKPMGNGHPMGAVITNSEIADSFNNGIEFFSSFGGNPVSCAIGLSVLEVLEEEELQENAKITGTYYKSLFSELQKIFPCIGDVRGSGLFLGVEIIKQNDGQADTDLANLIKNELRNRGILIGTDGPSDNVLKTKPPMCFTKDDARRVVEQIQDILNEKN